MRSDKSQFLSSMTTRQKVTTALFIVVIIVVIWQVVGLFRESKPKVQAAAAGTPAATTATAARSAVPTNPQQMTPMSAQLPRPEEQPMTQREMELLKLQQQTQANYIAAVNELQMLKVSKEIAETNQAIMAAKLATITAQKNIVDLLVRPAPQVTTANYAQGLVNPVSSGAAVTGPIPAPTTVPAPPAQPTTPPPPIQPQEVSYSVISVTQLQYKWNAVLGYQGNLYSVTIGDVMPPDGSRVIAIDKSGVMLEKNGVRKKISMVPII